MIKHYLSVLCALTFLSSISSAQTGPGGVGTTGTTGNVGLWLRADAITGTSSGAAVQNWPDASGRGSNAAQNTAASRPQYIQSSSFNNRPALRFNSGTGNTNTDDFMEVPSTPILAGSNGGDADAFTYFAVVRMQNLDGVADRGILSKRTAATSTGTAYTLFFNDEGAPQTLAYQIASGNTLDQEDNNVNYSNNSNHIIGFRFDGSIDDEDDRGVIYENGFLDGPYEHGFTTFNNNTAPITIGRIAGEVNTYSRMDVAEIIHYNRSLNSAEVIILQNYLAAKYAITIDDDQYSHDATHGNEVAGIGRVNGGNQQTVAQGTGIVRVSNADDLENGEFLLWGHNGTPLAQLSNNVPNSILATGQRLARTWRISENEGVGDVRVSFDVSSLPSITSTNYSNLRLLIDTDGNGNFNNATLYSPSAALSNFSGTNRLVVFDNVDGGDFSDNDYFTLGTINSTVTPLPVSFISFDASHQSGKVALKWTTATEENNNFFTVERSKDGQAWEEVTTIKGAGNSSQPLGYQALDVAPYTGISYYRIKQTDFDEKTSYSRVESVRVLSGESDIVLSPNPVKGGWLEVTLTDAVKAQQVVVTNLLGQVMHQQKLNSSSSVRIDTHSYPAGTYFVRLMGTLHNSVHKIVVE